MCPCDEACKTVRLVEIFIDLSRRKSVILGEETAEQCLPRAEVSGFVRLAFLRKNSETQDCMRRGNHCFSFARYAHCSSQFLSTSC